MGKKEISFLDYFNSHFVKFGLASGLLGLATLGGQHRDGIPGFGLILVGIIFIQFGKFLVKKRFK